MSKISPSDASNSVITGVELGVSFEICDTNILFLLFSSAANTILAPSNNIKFSRLVVDILKQALAVPAIVVNASQPTNIVVVSVFNPLTEII